jgi:transposase
MPHVPFPPITESAQELLELRRHEREERRRERLHALWLVVSGAVKSRAALAGQLGRNRETVSRWLLDYAHGGLAALLRPAQRPGPPSQGGIGLPEETKAAIRARLAESRGERGYLSLWRWAQAECGLTHSYSHFHRWVRDQLGAALKVARKSHGQKKRKHWRPFATMA